MKNTNLKNRTQNLIKRIQKVKYTLFTTPIFLTLMKAKVYAATSISTTETNY